VAENSWPFTPKTAGVPDAGSVSTNARWEAMMVQYGTDGVFANPESTLNDGGWLAVGPAADALAVDLDPGSGRVQGHYYENTAVKRFTVATAHATLLRIDHMVLRLTRTANGGSVNAAVVAGAPGSNRPPVETQTASVWEKRIATWNVPALAGRASGANTDFAERYARSEVGPLRSNLDPGARPLAAAGGTTPLPEGTKHWFADSDGNWLEYVLVNGLGWCIVPGQLLRSVTFADPAIRAYPGPLGIGDWSSGSVAASPARIQWIRPQCLPGHGYRYVARANILTGTGADSPAEGDVAGLQLYAEAPFYGLVGWQARQPLRDLGSAYNPSIELDYYAPGYDNALADPTLSASTVLVGTMPTGKIRFTDGQFSIYSA
jgi:hypothetical protein